MWLMSDGGQTWTLVVCTWCANQVGPYRKEKVTGWFAVSPPRVRRRRTLSKMKTHGRKQWTVNKRRRDTPHEIMELRCFHYRHIMSIGQSGEDRPSSDDAAVNICEATTTDHGHRWPTEWSTQTDDPSTLTLDLRPHSRCSNDAKPHDPIPYLRKLIRYVTIRYDMAGLSNRIQPVTSKL